MDFLKSLIVMLKEAIANGTISKDSLLLQRLKEGIIDMADAIQQAVGGKTKSRAEIGAIVDKAFADYLDVD